MSGRAEIGAPVDARAARREAGRVHVLGRIQHGLARRAVRRGFAAVRVDGLRGLAGHAGAVILCPMHRCWWDGFWASWLVRAVGRRFFLAQADEHLRRYPWFRLAGVMPVGAPGKRGRDQLAAMAAILRSEPLAALVYFGEGEMRLQEAGPPVARPGLAWLAEWSGCGVAPVAVRHGFRDGSKPEVWMRIGAVVPPPGANEDRREWTASFEEAWQGEDRRLRDAWNARGLDPAYQALWEPARPVNEGRWSGWLVRLWKRAGDGG